MSRAQFWAAALILTGAFWMFTIRTVVSQEVPLIDMVRPAPYADKYWPLPCESETCILTGWGGLISVWEKWADEHAGKSFVVHGICASACEIAYRRVLERGDSVTLRHDAQLVYHKPSSLN